MMVLKGEENEAAGRVGVRGRVEGVSWHAKRARAIALVSQMGLSEMKWDFLFKPDRFVSCLIWRLP